MAIPAAAWTLRGQSKPASGGVQRKLALPALFALTAVGILIYDHFERVSNLAVGLAGASLAIVIARMVLAFEENVTLLRRTQTEALTDPLTELPNRRKLLRDLADAFVVDAPSPPRLFAIFDLDGFKAYNDSFGHVAGDVLLTRLGTKLAAGVDEHGRAYRLGGDEFCILASLDAVTPDALLKASSAALGEEGEAFSITSSRGAVLLPQEADSPSEAMRLADRRMYAQKGTRPNSAERQTSTVLLRTLQEREPELGTHLEGVALLASVFARCLGLDSEQRDIVTRAAHLHDIGKVAVPDEILRKPGPLNDHEWEVMRNPHPHRGTHTRVRACSRSRRAARPLQPRALGRRRLPGQARGRGHTARRPHHRGLRRLRGDDRGPALVLAQKPGRGSRRVAQMCRHAVRPATGRCLRRTGFSRAPSARVAGPAVT